MSDQPKNANTSVPQNAGPTYNEPGVAVIRGVNWGGFLALYWKEVRRFFKVQLQTVWAPSITTLLFLVIFTVALGRGDRMVLGVPFADFIAPGLICMGMIQNAFANSSFLCLSARSRVPLWIILCRLFPLANCSVGLVAAAVTRAALVGFAVWLAMALWPGVQVSVTHWWAVIWFGLMGSVMLALLGVLTSIWAEKFDHAAAVTNFVVAPLALLSGTFYSIDRLSPAVQAFSHANPFFYAISGFRYGFLGESDSPILTGSVVLLVINLLLTAICYYLLKKGWKIKS